MMRKLIDENVVNCFTQRRRRRTKRQPLVVEEVFSAERDEYEEVIACCCFSVDGVGEGPGEETQE